MCIRSNRSPQSSTFLLSVVPFCSLGDDGHSSWMKADGNGGHVEWNDSMAALKHCGEIQARQMLAARNLRVAFWMQMMVLVAETEQNLKISASKLTGGWLLFRSCVTFLNSVSFLHCLQSEGVNDTLVCRAAGPDVFWHPPAHCGCFCRYHSSLQHRPASTYHQLIAQLVSEPFYASFTEGLMGKWDLFFFWWSIF